MSLRDIFRSKKNRNAGTVVEVAGIGMPDMMAIQELKIGMRRTCVIKLKCGACAESWSDAVEPKKEERLACPHCGATNNVTLNLTIYSVG